MKIIWRSLIAGTLSLITTSIPATQISRQAEELVFRVLLNDREIGVHTFAVSAGDGKQSVSINADFNVKFLAIPIYSYDHHSNEIWNNGCLESIASVTDDNGNKFYVDGKSNGKHFSVTTKDNSYKLKNNCVMTFAYWDKKFLSQKRLLNAQTGEYLPVEVSFIGTEQLPIGVEKVTAKRYKLRNEEQGVNITVWYDANTNKWLSLESQVDNRVIRYLPAENNIAARSFSSID